MHEHSMCLSQKSVLFVDDEADICDLMRDYLSLFFAQVHIAYDGQEGLDLYIRHRSEIVITDIKMPRLGGLEMARSILAIDPEVAIVVVSAHTENRYLHDALNLGIRYYEYKPIDLLMLKEKLQQACEHQELLYRLRLSQSVIDNTHDAVVIMDEYFGIAHVNAAFEAVTGYSKARVIGKPLSFVLSRESKNGVALEGMDRIIAHERKWQEKLWCRHKDGHRYPVWMTISVVEDEIHAKSFIALFSDISVLEAQEEQLQHIAYHDALTNLPNRNLLTQLLEQEMLHVGRNGGVLSLCFIDLDGFKEVNDLYGHDAGDYVLKETARRIRQTLRASDIAARLGGDEFVVVLSQLQSLDEAEPLLVRLLKHIEEPIAYDHHQLVVSASIGVSSFDQKAKVGTEVLLRQADQAMYNAKQDGKGRYHFFDHEASQRIARQNALIRSMETALEEGEFVLHYQPQVEMHNGRVIGFEALLRWACPGKDLCYPDSFLPQVSSHGALMRRIDMWVFERACIQLQTWKKQGLEISISINSTINFFHIPDLTSLLKERIERCGVDASKIEFELLESIGIADFQATIKVLEALRAMGFKIAIDDFGTGYASLEYIKQMSVDTIKIDRSFVQDLFKTRRNLSIIEATIALSQAFRCEVIAEGVESEEQGRLLLSLGCTKAQGYLIAKPFAPEAIGDFLNRWEGIASWRSITPLHLADRSIIHAKIEHHLWLEQFLGYMYDQSDHLPLMNHRTCYFGAWLLSEEARQYAVNPLFQEITTMHYTIHQKADFLIEAQAPCTKETLDAFVAENEHMIVLLDVLMQ